MEENNNAENTESAELSEEEIEKLLIEFLLRAVEARQPPPVPEPEPEPVFEPDTENEAMVYEVLRATVYELEDVKRRLGAIEDLLLLKYRSKDTLSH